MIDWLTQLITNNADSAFVQGVLVFIGTFILEDPTTVGSGLIVAHGGMAFSTALVALTLGIAGGDMVLYVLGRLFGDRCVGWGMVSPQRFERAQHWMRSNVIPAVLVSRFVPGLRLPTYLAAGVLKAPVLRFMGIVFLAGFVWSFLLLTVTVRIGEAILPALGQLKWPAAFLAVAAFATVQYTARKKFFSEEPGSGSAGSFFEFWPPWLFYAPVVVYYVYLSIRHGGLTIPTVANPSIYSGGMVRESKSQILGLVPRRFRDVMLRLAVLPPRERSPQRALKAMEGEGISFPCVVKPDHGQRGDGVRLVRHEDQLRHYLAGYQADAPLLIQELADMPYEAGIFYVRLPGHGKGRIFSITLKSFPFVVGDGQRTLRELIEADPRARRIRQVYFARHSRRLRRVVPEGKKVPLVFAGNHCQGSIFRNGRHLATKALRRRMDEIASSMPEFYFGRFDVRFADMNALRRGEGFKIVEINGASSEATHIWDAETSLVDAYKTLFEQFRLLFLIGVRNRRRGIKPIGVKQFLRDVFEYRRLARQYPPAS